MNRDSQSRLDVKKAGIFPIVHGTRVLAMEAGITDSNTFDRLRALAAQGLAVREMPAGDTVLAGLIAARAAMRKDKP